MSIDSDVADLLRPLLGGAGVQLVAVTVTAVGRQRRVRVIVDTPLPEAAFSEDEAGDPIPPLDLDAIADATRLVGDILDGADLLGSGAYTLEVTSPGVGRPLEQPEHFRRNVGRLVRLVTRDEATEIARVTRVTRAELTVQVPAAKKRAAFTWTVPFTEVTRGEIQVEFARSQPGEDHCAADPQET